MKKILPLIVTIGLIATITSNLISCSSQPKNVLPEGEIKDLSSVENLKIRINIDKSKEQIMTKILNDFQFKGIKSKDVNFKEGSLKMPKKDGENLVNGEVIVESNGKNEKVIGETSTIVLIALEPQRDISSFNFKNELKDVEGSTANVIIKKFIETNKNILVKNTSDKDFVIANREIHKPSTEYEVGEGKAKIVANPESELYMGFIEVVFTIIKKENLKNLKLITEIGEVRNNGLYEVSHTFWLVNQEKIKTNTGFKYKKDGNGSEQVTEESAIIVGGDSELYVGEIEVFFNIG